MGGCLNAGPDDTLRTSGEEREQSQEQTMQETLHLGVVREEGGDPRRRWSLGTQTRVWDEE